MVTSDPDEPEGRADTRVELVARLMLLTLAASSCLWTASTAISSGSVSANRSTVFISKQEVKFFTVLSIGSLAARQCTCNP